MQISVVLPTHNELQNIKVLIPQIKRLLKGIAFEIIVVDDASTDGSQSWLKKQAKVKPIIGSKLNGIGNALRRGYNKASGNIIVSLDADLSIDPKIILKLIKKLKVHDLVIGSRHCKQGKYLAPNQEIRKKRLISKISNKTLSVLVPIGISDFSINCRGIKKSLWKKLNLQEKTNIWLIEMIIKSAQAKARVSEIPLTFKDRQYGSSKLKLGREIFLTGYRVILMIYNFHFDN